MRYAAFLAALLITQSATAAPNPADIAGYRTLVEQDVRLAATGYRIAYANRNFCRRTERNPGFVMHDILQYPDTATARAAFGFENPVIVSAIVPNGPAASAGLRVGDGLVGIAPDKANDANSRIAAIKTDMQKQLLLQGYLTLQIARNGQPVSILISPPEICASDFQIDTVHGKDAGADGAMVSISIGLASYTPDSDEFAYIVAHEMAHNILGHQARLVHANLQNNSKAVLATEIEADRLSVWLMNNAGYDPQRAISFAARCRKDRCLGLFTDNRHLSWKKRAEIMQAEIDLNQAAPVLDGAKSPPLLLPE